MSGSSIRVLLIEDDPEYAYLLQEMLKTARSASFDVTHANHLSDGVNHLAEGSFDIILLDLSLPDSWGFETFATIYAHASHIPIIPLSGLDDERLAMRAVREGAQDYLVKGETDAKLLTRALCYAIERKRSERALREQRDRIQQYLDIAGVIIVVIDADQRVTLVNKKGCEVLGYEEAEIVGKKWFDSFVPERIRAQVKAAFAQLMAGEVEPVEKFENPVLTKSGEERVIAWDNTILRDESGNITHTLSSGEDITEHRRAEQLLEGLNQAALAMERALTPGAIFTAVAGELKRLGFSCMVLPVDENRSRLFTKYVSFESEPIRAAEKLVGFRQHDFSFPIENVDAYKAVVWGKKTISICGDEVMQQILPGPLKRLAGQVLRIVKIPRSIAAPLIVKGDVIGVLSVHSNELTEGDIPAITAFAHQLAAAWHRAQLFEQAQQEIAERKRAESALRESERRFATFMEHLPGVAFMKDTQGRYLYHNRALGEAQGAKIAEWRGKTDDEIWPADTSARMKANDRRVIAEGQGLETIEKIPQEDGFHHWLTIKFPITDENGKPSVLAGIAVDVTEHLQAQEELRHRNEELVALNAVAMTINQSLDLDHTLNASLDKVMEVIKPDGGWIQLLDEVTGTLSLAAHRGLSPEMIKGTETTEWGEGITGEAIQLGQAVVVTDACDGRCLGSEVAERDGLQACAAVPIISKGKTLGALGICSRNTRQMSAQEMQLLAAIGHQIGTAIENARLAKEAAEVHVLQELNRLSTELIANVSHELRTPLGLIKVYSTTLLTEDVYFDRETQKECLRTIDEETERLETIVDNLLDLSRMEGGRLHLDRRPTDVRQLAKEIVQAMEIQTTQHRFALDLPTYPLTAHVDARRIEQVLRNLLSNAIKYSPEGGMITIQARGDDDQLLVGISDEGIGIPPHDLDRVFERFYRVDNEVTQRVGGAGLGLAVCKGIVKAHGGRIWVESSLGEGSAFYFTLRDKNGA
jgi:PAS domain S-box-containing protein